MSKLQIFAPATLITMALLLFGGLSLNAPLQLGGPLANGIAPAFLGSLALVLGIRLCQRLATARPTLTRWLFAGAFTAMLIAGGWNFFWYPPIQDGAYLIARYGGNEVPWPAGVLPTVLLVSGLVILLQGALSGHPGTVPEPAGKADTTAEIGVFTGLAIVLLAAYAASIKVLVETGTGWWMLIALGGAGLVFAIGIGLNRRYPVTIWLCYFAGAFAALVLSTTALFASAVG